MCRINKALFSLLLTIVLFNSQAFSENESVSIKPGSWTFIIYIQSDPILDSFIVKSIKEITSIEESEGIHIIMQLNQPYKKGICRYEVKNKSLKPIDIIESVKERNLAKEIIDLSNLAVNRCPAENYAIIFSSHGSGILEPAWDKLQNFMINLGNDQYCNAINRGMLFDTTNKSYLENGALKDVLEYVTSKIFKKKLAILGMDVCFGAMFEVFYQIKDYADYSVTSEEVELAKGWDYSSFLSPLVHNNFTSKDLAINIVHTFQSYYKNRTRFATQSAVDLSLIETLKQNIDRLVFNISRCASIEKSEIQNMLINARKNCFQLSVPYYVDLHSLYTELYFEIMLLEKSCSEALYKSHCFLELKATIQDGFSIIDKVIIANTTTNHLSRARGISIYFPQTRPIDSSYLGSEFAQNSLWLHLLQEFSPQSLM